MKRKWLFAIICVILAGVSLWGALYLSDIKSYEDWENKTQCIYREIDMDALIPQGYTREGDTFTSVNNDAGFVVDDVGSYILDLRLRFTEPPEENINIQVYYAKDTDSFGDHQVAAAVCPASENEVIIWLGERAGALRIDVTSQSGQSFKLNRIDYNHIGQEQWSWSSFFLRALLLWLGLVFVFSLILLDRGKILSFIEQNRYLLAIGFVVFCVIFEIHGSSLAQWANFMPTYVDTYRDTLFGTPRAIRTDEWATFTPMTISQSFGSNPYAWFSDLLRGMPTDMFMIYAQPVYTPLIIFRPFLIGFLFLGTARGLAFFWAARLACLLLVTYEFFKVITKSKKLSGLASLLIAFAPVIQWWFAINGLVEMLIFAQLSLLMLMMYMKTDKFWRRCMALLVITVCAVGFIFTLYPAWQIPVFYIIIGSAVCIIAENHKGFRLKLKDIAALIGAAAIGIFCIGAFLYNSHETINAVMNTAYPGHRVSTGGNVSFKALLQYWGNLFFPFVDSGMPGNACESAVFMDFFPLGMVLSIYVMISKKKIDIYLITYNILFVIFFAFAFIGIPEFLAKVTLLSMSTGNRVYMILGFVNILILFRAISFFDFLLKRWIIWGAALLYAAVSAVMSKIFYGEYLSSLMVVIIAITALFICVCILAKAWKIFGVLACTAVLIGGGGVNPVQKGIDILYESNLAEYLKSGQWPQDKWWAMVNCDYPIMEYPLLFGLPTVNSTNTYPAFPVWEKLDVDGVYEDVYNRYAHVSIWIDEKNLDLFELTNADAFRVNINDLEKLKLLNVGYLISPEDLSAFDGELALLQLVDGYYIYEIE